jgi:hypothetical protein
MNFKADNRLNLRHNTRHGLGLVKIFLTFASVGSLFASADFG